MPTEARQTMSVILRRAIFVAVALLALGVTIAAVGLNRAAQRLDHRWQVPARDVPVPWPLDEQGLAELRADRLRALEDRYERQNRTAAASIAAGSVGPSIRFEPFVPPADPLQGLDLTAHAEQRALERGRHLVEHRLGCAECHGEDYGGKLFVDELPVLKLVPPNITPAGVVAGWSAGDWDRAIRHGVREDGRAAIMPSGDYAGLSDQELSDMITFLRSVPPVERSPGATEVGWLGRLLIAAGRLPIAAEEIDHRAAPPTTPPPAAVTAAFGAHVGQACTGCHGANLSGGPIPGAPPDWAPAANLTSHPTGLAAWTEDQFLSFLDSGVRPDGSKAAPSMPLNITRGLTRTERQALWAWLRSLPPRTAGGR